jgi:hypothetical protein
VWRVCYVGWDAAFGFYNGLELKFRHGIGWGARCSMQQFCWEKSERRSKNDKCSGGIQSDDAGMIDEA